MSFLKPVYCRWEVEGWRRGQEEAGFCRGPSPLTPDSCVQFILTSSEPRGQPHFRFLAPFLAADNYLTHLCIAIINFYSFMSRINMQTKKLEEVTVLGRLREDYCSVWVFGGQAAIVASSHFMFLKVTEASITTPTSQYFSDKS